MLSADFMRVPRASLEADISLSHDAIYLIIESYIKILTLNQARLGKGYRGSLGPRGRTESQYMRT